MQQKCGTFPNRHGETGRYCKPENMEKKSKAFWQWLHQPEAGLGADSRSPPLLKTMLKWPSIFRIHYYLPSGIKVHSSKAKSVARIQLQCTWAVFQCRRSTKISRNKELLLVDHHHNSWKDSQNSRCAKKKEDYLPGIRIKHPHIYVHHTHIYIYIYIYYTHYIY